MIITELLTIARKKDNRAADATGGGLWVSDTNYVATVPTGKRWILMGGVVYLSDNATLNVYHRDSSDNVLARLATYAAGTGYKPYPIETYAGATGRPLVLDAGEDISAVAGASQGATAFATCLVLEIDN